MASDNFYFHLCHYLLTKFANNHIEIPMHEWEKSTDKEVQIKHRINENDRLEVVSIVVD